MNRTALDPDVVYYNADIINNNTEDAVGNEADPQVSIYAQRQFPILQDVNDYMLSCIRLNTSGATQNLPLWIPRIQTANSSSVFTGSIQTNTATGVTELRVVTQTGAIPVGASFSGSGFAQLITSTGNVVVPVTFGSNSLQPNVIATAPPPFSTATPAIFTLTTPCPPINYNGVLYGDYQIFNCSLSIGSEQQDPDLTVYSVTVVNPATGATSRQFLRWTPENVTVPPPTNQGQNIISQNISSEYYYGYTFQNFANMFNTALGLAWTATGLGAGDKPQLVYARYSNPDIFSFIPNPPAGTFSLLKSGGAFIFMNSNLAGLLPYFPSQNTNQPQGCSVRFDFSAVDTTTTATLDQEYPGASAWSPVDALVVTTSTIPVIPEQVSAPGYVGSSNFGNNAVVASAFQNIVADISIYNVSGVQDWRSDIAWSPTAEYQMVSLMNSSSPLNIIDLQVWWRCRLDNNLYPLRLVNGSSVSLKLMFRRKQLGV